MTQNVSEDLIERLVLEWSYFVGLAAQWSLEDGEGSDERVLILRTRCELLRETIAALQSERAARLRVEAALERGELARIIRGWELPPTGQRIGPGTLRAIREADAKADLIRAEALGVSQGGENG